MMMAREFDVEPRGAALDGHFSQQTRLHQITQIVVSGGPGTTRVRTIDRLEDFGSRGMAAMF